MGARTLAMSHPLDQPRLKALLRDILPRENDFGAVDYQELLTELQTFGISDRRALRALLLRHRHELRAIDRAPLDAHNAKIQREEMGDVQLRFHVRRGVFFNYAGLVRLALERQVGAPYRDYLGQRRAAASGGTL